MARRKRCGQGSAMNPQRIRRVGVAIFGAGLVLAVGLMVVKDAAGSHLAGSSLVDQIDAKSAAPRYGVPHLLHVLSLAGWDIAILVGIPVWVVGWVAARRQGRRQAGESANAR